MAALPRLIALSPGDLVPGSTARFLEALEGALEAGLPGFLLREPGLADGAYLELAAEVARRRAGRPLWFAVHDRPHLARALGADAVHLSFRSLRAEELAPWLERSVLRGLSTHASDDPAAWRGADYLFHGPLHATPRKARALEPLGLEGLERARRLAPCPVLALGGVRPEDVGPLRARGLHGVAVLSGILGAPDPRSATASYLEALG